MFGMDRKIKRTRVESGPPRFVQVGGGALDEDVLGVEGDGAVGTVDDGGQRQHGAVGVVDDRKLGPHYSHRVLLTPRTF